MRRRMCRVLVVRVLRNRTRKAHPASRDPRFATKDCQARKPSGVQHFLLSKTSDDARRTCLPVAPVRRRTGSLDGTKHGDVRPANDRVESGGSETKEMILYSLLWSKPHANHA